MHPKATQRSSYSEVTLAIQRRWQTRLAFTLVELLTSIGILAIIMAILFSAFDGASNATIRNNSRVEVNQVVRAVLDLMTRDIERTLYSTEWVTMYKETAVGQLVPGVPTNTLYVLTDLARGEQNCNGNDGVNIGYRIAQTSVGGINKWVLQRGDNSLVEPTDHPTDWWLDGYFLSFEPLPGDANYNECYNTNYWKILSENVIGVQFQFFTNATLTDIDSSISVWDDTTPPVPLPYSVGITLCAIDTDNYNRALKVDPNLTSAASQTIISNNVRYYYTRVFLPRSSENP